jgi:GNAT superfamily N-acetyltransferase
MMAIRPGLQHAMDRMILLRNARQDELSGLSGLCLRSKAHWGYDGAFMAACRAELTLHPDDLETTSLQVAERAGSVAGLAQVRVTGADADLLKLFIEPALIGAGVGRLLFEWATAKARELGAVRMMIEADPDAAPFYERMGAHHAGSVASGSIPGRMLPRMLKKLGGQQGACGG